jgi:hypothetical protein
MPVPVEEFLDRGRIRMEALVRAVQDIEALDLQGRLALCDEIAAEQPNLLAAILAATQMRPGAFEGDLLLKILMVSFQAMRRSGARWALITEDEQERQLSRLTGCIRFTAGETGGFRKLAETLFVAEHPEPILLTYVFRELTTWLARPDVQAAAQEADKFVLLAAINTVQCIGYGAVALDAGAPVPKPVCPGAGRRS